MKKYNVIYADPAWQYDNKKTGGSMISGAEAKYVTMDMWGMMNMPINEITEKNAVCFMWAVVPMMPEAFRLLEAWGFTYKTMLTWDKQRYGTGFWFRGQTEHLLLGVKGKVKPFRNTARNIFSCPSGLHSQKPHHIRELISKAVQVSFPEPKKLELFARSREGLFPDYEYSGWDVWGNQVNNSIQLPDIKLTA